MIARWIAALALALFLAAASPARADSWLPPRTASYLSPDQQTRLTVVPRGLESQLAYFEDKVAKQEPAGQAPGETRTTAHAVLERRDGKGGWTRIWEAPLVNEVAPTRALVANGGQYVVTFDNWFSTGYGPDVVVIYGADGRHLRSFALTDLLPESYVRALPHSVSSLWWGGEHRLSPDGRRLILAVVVPSPDRSLDREETVDVAIDLASTTPVPPSGPAWDRALAQASEVARARDAEEAADRAAFLAQLLGPSPADEEDWHLYLREAFSRLDPDWDDGHVWTQLLRSPEATDYKPSENWLRGVFKQVQRDGGSIAIASLASPDHLVRILTQAAGSVKPGSLARVRIYVAIPAAWRDRVAAVLAPSRATFIHLDPVAPIPQSPERLKRLEEANQSEEVTAQLEADADQLEPVASRP